MGLPALPSVGGEISNELGRRDSIVEFSNLPVF